MSRRATKSQIHDVLDTASTSAKSLADTASTSAKSLADTASTSAKSLADTASTSAKSLAYGAKKPAANASTKIKRSKKKKFGLLVVAGAAIAAARSLRKPR